MSSESKTHNCENLFYIIGDLIFTIFVIYSITSIYSKIENLTSRIEKVESNTAHTK